MSTEAAALIAPLAVAAGWIGQACFFSRFLLQWLASERARRSVVPHAFWRLSLAGAVLLSAYASFRGEYLLLSGFLASALISAGNLRLERHAPRPPFRARQALFPGLLFLVLLGVELGAHSSSSDSPRWLWVAGIGQAFWVARFPLQWWLSERAGESHFPAAFWWSSLIGNALLLIYALHLGDALFVLGFLPGPLLQVRNLALGRSAAGG